MNNKLGQAAISKRTAMIVAFLLCMLPADAETYEAKVIGVSDGDTIKLLRGKKAETVRLADIDAPEKNQAFGAAAKKFTSNLVYGKTVDVDTLGRDRYGRIIARVHLENGQSVNRELVKSGFAWRFVQYRKDEQLGELERTARDNKRGLWKAPDAVPPWDFRNRQHLDRQETKPTG